MKSNSQWKAIFMNQGKFLAEGDEIKRPLLARTLRILADEGADAFYHASERV